MSLQGMAGMMNSYSKPCLSWSHESAIFLSWWGSHGKALWDVTLITGAQKIVLSGVIEKEKKSDGFKQMVHVRHSAGIGNCKQLLMPTL
jgi:hypothetical protein